MCGIVGFNWEDKKIIRKMSDAIFHRGPDHGDSYTDSGISIGYRRLAIIDLSDAGNQPMYNESKNKVIVFNGEIYNFKEIREKLIKKHKFESNTDTEAIIHGYEEYGEKICNKIKGMFAFAIWDKKEKKLFIARDHIGEKPLYYYFDGVKFIFASEIKAILVHEIKTEIDERNLSDYIELRFSSKNRTMFKGIKKLEPGHYLIYKKGKIEIRKYWDIPEFNSTSEPNQKKFDELISSAINEKMMSDVPVGVFLSGGLDSSTIVSYLKNYKDKIKTFSIGFNDSTDETKYAEIVSKKFNTEHYEIIADEDSFVKFLPEIVWHLDEPMADPASIPSFLLSKEVSKKVKVALSGEGGDEVFGGYDSPNLLKNIRRMHKIPIFLRKNIGANLTELSSHLFKYPNKQKLKLVSEILKSSNLREGYKKLFYLPFSTEDKEKILIKEIKDNSSFGEYFKDEKKLLEGTYRYYFKEWLPNDLLMKTDKMGMAHSLEIRAPFLDKDLVEYSIGLNWKYKEKRNLFRKIIKNRLPREILNRKKQGFTLPLTRWFNNGDFLNRTKEHFQDLKRRRIFKEELYDSIINNPKKFRNDHRMWVLLNLELWNKIYIDKIPFKKIKI